MFSVLFTFKTVNRLPKYWYTDHGNYLLLVLYLSQKENVVKISFRSPMIYVFSWTDTFRVKWGKIDLDVMDSHICFVPIE